MSVDITNAVWIDVNSSYLQNTKPELLTDINAINNSLHNLFSCSIGSRYGLREYGSNLYYYLQEPVDNITAGNLRSSLVQSIERWEPRIKVNLGQTYVSPLTNNDGYFLYFTYRILSVNSIGSLSLTAKKLTN